MDNGGKLERWQGCNRWPILIFNIIYFIDLKFPPCASSPWKAFCEGVCVLGEKLFAVGGYDGSGYLSLVEAYDSRLEDLGWILQVKILWDEQLFPQRELLEGSGVVEYWTRRSLCRCCAKVASRYLMMMMMNFKNTIRYEGSTALYTALCSEGCHLKKKLSRNVQLWQLISLPIFI